jgi:tRNA threonylcarbamoyladenosine biosynthesis protein TsaB
VLLLCKQAMNLLAIDTATEQCSVAIQSGDKVWSRITPTQRSHADLVLPMIDALLHESQLTLADMDALAFGRGPGSFTGVRIAVGVIQGLALASSKPVIGVSNLAVVAQQAATQFGIKTGEHVLVCMDARMQEVYWATYRLGEHGYVELQGREQVSAPVDVQAMDIALGVGTGWRAYPQLRERYAILQVDDTLLPNAIGVLRLAAVELMAGRIQGAADAQPVYLRDKVVFTGA